MLKLSFLFYLEVPQEFVWVVVVGGGVEANFSVRLGGQLFEGFQALIISLFIIWIIYNMQYHAAELAKNHGNFEDHWF